MSTFPTSIPSYTNPSSSNFLNSPSHATQHSSNNDDTVAIATKVGSGSSAPSANTYLKGDGSGTSSWTDVPTQSAWVSDSDGATITFDLSAGNKHKVTLGGNRILALSSVLSGHVFVIKLTQDGTGTRTVTWFGTITWPGGTAPTLTTSGGKSDVFGFIQTSTGNYDGFIVGLNL